MKKQTSSTRPTVDLEAAKEACSMLVRQTLPLNAWLEKKSLISTTEVEEASNVLIMVKDLHKQLKNKYDEYRAPIKTLTKLLDDDFKTPIKKLETLETYLKYNLISPFIQKQQEAAVKKVEKLAVKEEKNGNVQYAEDIRIQAKASVEKPSDIQTRESIGAELRDIKALCKAIGEGLVPESLVEFRGPVANALYKAGMKEIPGVEFVKKMILAVGGNY